jgi:hypothetical protein
MQFRFNNIETSSIFEKITGDTSNHFWTAVLVIASSLLTAGCWAPPTIAGPDRLYSTDAEMVGLLNFTDVTGDDWSKYLSASPGARMGFRNEIMAARMYAIDVNYTKFEHELSIEGQSVEFWTKLGSNSLTAATAAVPAASTVKQLNAIATGFNLASSSYTEAFFRKQLIENLVAAMRAARHERRAVIRTRMTCHVGYYPFGLGMSDVESYFRAGSLESGILRLTQTITAEEKKTKGEDDVAGPTAAPEAKKTQKEAVKAAASADSDKTAKSGCGTDVIASILQDPGVAGLNYQTRYAARRPSASQPTTSQITTQTASKKSEAAPIVQ